MPNHKSLYQKKLLGAITILAVAAGGCQSYDDTDKKEATMENYPAGDRAPQVNVVFPENAFYDRNTDCCILNVKAPPFNAKGDGVTDDTQALCAAMRFVREHLSIIANKDGHRQCGHRLTKNWLIYLPDGEYLVSDTVSQGFPALAMNILNGWNKVNFFEVESPLHEESLYCRNVTALPYLHDNPQLSAYDDNHGNYMRGQYGMAEVYDECNWAIRIFGQSRQKTIIRLKDHANGFGARNPKPVLSFYLLQRGSNINIGNFLENVTIDIGRGNLGAIGLQWNNSNFGAIRNVAVRSGNGAGHTGIRMHCNNATGQIEDVRIDGFERGLDLAAGRETMIAMEYVTLSDQKLSAIHVGDAGSGAGGDSLSARKIRIDGCPNPVQVGAAGQLMLLDCEIRTKTGGTAIALDTDAFLLARQVSVSGYKHSLASGDKFVCGDLSEFASKSPLGGGRALELAVKDAPVILPKTDFAQWADIRNYGAKCDGIADDTVAIQRAVDSGKSKIFFSHPNCVINGTVRIPASVREIDCQFAAIVRTKSNVFDGPGFFEVAESSATPLLIHHAYTAGGVFVDHAADRPVVMADISVLFHHCRSLANADWSIFASPVPQNTEVWRLYRNSTPQGKPKEIFVNNCIGFAPGGKDNHLAVENVRCWARSIDSEHTPGPLYSFRKSDVWIFGLKSENADTLLAVSDHSRVEVLGGSFLNWSRKKGPSVAIDSTSAVTALFYLWHWRVAPVAIMNTGGHPGIVSTDITPLQKEDAAVIYVSGNQIP